MGLLYKEDWEETKERYKAWWAHEYFGRCALAVTAPRDDALDEAPPAEPATPLERWTDLDYLSALNTYRHRRTFYGGEAFPIWNPGYAGYRRLGVFLGCPITLDFQTGWLDPILIDGITEFESLRLDESEPHFQSALELLQHEVVEAKGESIPSIGAFGGCGDTLAALRGTDKLLYDIADTPDVVRAADQFLMDLWIGAYKRFYDIIKDTAEGSTCWFTLWSPGKFYATQNDFAYMIGPDMFRDVFLPTLEKQTAFLDNCVHHVDGVGNFAHVDALCELSGLDALQILPGAGKPSPLHYMDVLKKVQAAGKNLHIGIPATEVKDALDNLSARGLFISTSCKTEGEAKELLKNAEKWSRE